MSKRLAVVIAGAVIVYFLQFCVMVMGYINGWGLEVKSWGWIIGTFVASVILMSVAGQLLIDAVSDVEIIEEDDDDPE